MRTVASLMIGCLIGSAACGGNGGGDDTQTCDPFASDSFIAFGACFTDFRTWNHFHSDGPTEANCGMSPTTLSRTSFPGNRRRCPPS